MNTVKFKTARCGPKPFGEKPMSSVERKRRSRQKLISEGGKEYMVKIEGVYMNAVREIAHSSTYNENEVLKMVFETALDRIIEVVNKSAEYENNGVDSKEIEKFLNDNLYPKIQELPNQ